MLFKILLIAFFYAQSVLANIDNRIAGQVFEYFGNIKNATVDFTQEDNKQQITQGKLLITRPYQFRCNYYPPYPLLIVGNKKYISIYDYEMEQLTTVPTKENNFGFLLSEELVLSKNLTIIGTYQNERQLQVVVQNNDTDAVTEITLTKHPLELFAVKIIESDNQYIRLVFRNFTNINFIAPKLFKIRNPDIFGPPLRLDAQSIQKYYK